MNIFNIINSVTSRIEPFHSEFLSTCLRKDQKLRNQLLGFILPENLKKGFIESSNHEMLEIRSEDVFHNKKRIDIIIHDKKNKQIIGIEVKTTDSSVTENQLLIYLEGMQTKYNDHSVYMVYLTPYNRENIPSTILPGQISSIREFDQFNKLYSKSIHINWKDVVELYPNDNSNSFLYCQHRQYIIEQIIDDSSLISKFEFIERNRSFSEFIGNTTFENFIKFLQRERIFFHETEKEFTVFLNENTEKFLKIITLIEILTSSENLDKTVTKRDEVDQSLIDSYENSRFKDFFIMLFSTIQQYKYLWLKGNNRIGLRAPHSSHKSSGVSLLTINFDSIKIVKER